ncbi:MAG: hypothetical protein JXA79_03985 [Deltaproteobacteria bacterium]|nr:hypothetical protein [Deltaproteobacteria bacterium]
MPNYHQIQFPGPSDVAMNILYNVLWFNLPRRSFISGLWLRTYFGTDLFPNCFHPVLDLRKYLYFRHYLGNYVLLTPGEAGLLIQGTEEERIQYSLILEEQSRGRATAEWSKIKDLEPELIKLYKQYFPSTRGMLINYHYSMEEQGRILGKLNKKYLQELK